MPPRGSTSAQKGKAAAANDNQQLKLGWSLKTTPSTDVKRPKAPLPESLATTRRAPKAQKVSSTRDPVVEAYAEDISIKLEVSAVINSMIDKIVAENEKSAAAIEVETRSWLSALIDRVVVNSAETVSSFVGKLKHRRSTYSKDQKQQIVNLVSGAGESAKKAVAEIQKVSGYEKVTTKMVREWASARHKAAKKPGPKIDEEFETQVLSQLVYSEMEKVNDVTQAVVKANVAHSYAVIQRAAETVQKMAPFDARENIKAKKFSKPWVKGFLARAALRRRRVTASEKVLPSNEVVRGRMGEIQKVIVDEKYTDEETISADETGIFFGAPPKNQYVPESAARGTAAESDDKARFTSLQWGKGTGKMGPSFNIIKMSVKGTDLSTSTCSQWKP